MFISRTRSFFFIFEISRIQTRLGFYKLLAIIRSSKMTFESSCYHFVCMERTEVRIILFRCYLLQEALEVLRTTPSTVELVVCRLPGDSNVSPPGEPPPPPARREPPPSLRILNPLPPLQIEPCGVSNVLPKQRFMNIYTACSHYYFQNK